MVDCHRFMELKDVVAIHVHPQPPMVEKPTSMTLCRILRVARAMEYHVSFKSGSRIMPRYHTDDRIAI